MCSLRFENNLLTVRPAEASRNIWNLYCDPVPVTQQACEYFFRMLATKSDIILAQEPEEDFKYKFPKSTQLLQGCVSIQIQKY